MKLRLLFVFLLLINSSFAREGRKIVGTGDGPIEITISSPKGGWTVNRMMKIAGSISDTTINPVTVSVNGSKYLIRTSNGSFGRKFPMNSGKNAIEIIAVNKAGTFVKSTAVYGKFSTVPVQLVLTSDTDNVYTDLHVYEPNEYAPLGSMPNVHVSWNKTNSPSGGTLYLNSDGGDYDKPGYGPYLYTHSAPPLGIYKVDANYWPSGDKAHTKANLEIILFAGTANELRKTVQFPLVKSGETSTLAWIKIDKNQVGFIYSPKVDRVKDQNIWPAWVN